MLLEVAGKDGLLEVVLHGTTAAMLELLLEEAGISGLLVIVGRDTQFDGLLEDPAE